MSFPFWNLCRQIRWRLLENGRPPGFLTSSAIHTTQFRATFWEREKKSGYKTAITMPSKKEMILDGMRELRKEIQLWKEEVKEQFAMDPIVVYRPGEIDVAFDFKGTESLDKWIVSTDSDHNEGKSTAALVLNPSGNAALFYGHVSSEVIKDGSMKRAGYANIRTKRVRSKEVVYRGHTGSVDQLCWHFTNPDLLSTASGDKSVRIWDIRTQKCSSITSTKGENINITWSPDGKTIAVGNKEDLVTFIDTRTNKIRVEEQFNFEVNEIAWNNSGELFFLTNGLGCVHILNYPNLELQHILRAHPATCICIEFDPTGKYFATGSADALVSLWDANELACLRVIPRLDWPVRTISFSYDGKLLASGSEDLLIDIAYTETGEKVSDVSIDSGTFTVAWHPKRYLLAYACDDKDSNDRRREAGNLKVFGFSE